MGEAFIGNDDGKHHEKECKNKEKLGKFTPKPLEHDDGTDQEEHADGEKELRRSGKIMSLIEVAGDEEHGRSFRNIEAEVAKRFRGREHGNLRCPAEKVNGMSQIVEADGKSGEKCAEQKHPCDLPEVRRFAEEGDCRE